MTNIVFVYNMQEGIPTEDRSKHLVTMCEELGVDMNQDDIVTSQDGSRKSVKFAHSLGIKPGSLFNNIEAELTDFKMAVLSKTIKNEKRIKVTLGNSRW